MKTFSLLARNLARDRRGATLVEYMILVGVALLLVGVFGAFGSAVKTRLSSGATPTFRPMSLLGL